ncbi:MAG: tryptophan-rich sensory protein [Myxococcales bacterium]|nr:tryptophan-rich sensory protein [Myxococcales bacterium]
MVGWIALCQAAGGLGALATSAAWYRALDRPAWAPPGWVFGPVWLTLYAAMGVAAWLVWRTPSGAARTRALRWFGLQLGLNAAWTPVFFGLRSLVGGLVVIVALLAAIVATIVAFAPRSRPAAWLLAPYLAWVAFAAALNAALWWLAR